ncbi:ABC transporter permease [uncultured Cellulomonas sp.]|uniref:ABC transporter permease n=1 Tax=uncultured Cellulomonas sp. TaxID=189682 RepID=UPI002630697F|nr:ABC transporter permease [uncultured Cellulomonas sp.]
MAVSPTTSPTSPPGGSSRRLAGGASSSVREDRQRSFEIVRNLTVREVRTQFKRTALGRLWSFINPLVTLAILSVVFGLFLRVPFQPSRNGDLHVFVLFLAAALIPWNFMSGAITAGMNSLVVNSGLLTKVYFPRFVLPMSVILSMTLTFAIEMGVLLVVVGLAGGFEVLLFVPAIAVFMVLISAFAIGIAMSLSIAMVYFRDTQHIMSLFMQLWFYATPIIYPLTLITDDVQQRVDDRGWTVLGQAIPLELIYGLNPAAAFTGAFRTMIYDYAWPTAGQWVICLAWAVASVLVGLLVFRKFSARVVEEL